MRKPGIIQIREISCEGEHQPKNKFSQFGKGFFFIVFIIDLMNLFEEAVWFLIFGL